MPDRFHQLVAFDQSYLSGNHKHVFRSLSLEGDSFNDQTESFAITGGVWQLYDHFEFVLSRGSLFSPRIGGYVDAKAYDLAGLVSSFELVDDDERLIPHAILFEKNGYRGSHEHVFASTKLVGASQNSRSLAVLVGTWRVRMATGQTIQVRPGLYDVGSQLGPEAIDSMALQLPVIAPTSPIPHLIVFEDENFRGNHDHIFQGRMWAEWGISSLAVESGAWQAFVEHDSTSSVDPKAFGLQGPVLTRGIYPSTDDVEIGNGSISEFKLLPTFPAQEVALVTDSKIFAGVAELTAHGENYRLGWNRNEKLLSPANVRSPYFSQLWATRIPGARVYGQPLFVDGKTAEIPGGTSLVVFGTSQNEVLGLNAATGAIVWRTALGVPVDNQLFNSGIAHSSIFVGDCHNTSPLHGVNSTLVIDPSQRVVYAAYLTEESPGVVPSVSNNFNQEYYLQALTVRTGQPLWPNRGVKLAGSMTRQGRQPLPFLPYMHTQRSALTYFSNPLGNFVLVPFSSRCDYFGKDHHEDWQGWIIGVDVSQSTGRSPFCFASSQEDQNNGCGGIWGTAGLAVDDHGFVYTVTGNGTWNGTTNWADSILRLHFDGNSLRVVAHYTPKDWRDMRDNDHDLGIASPILLPSQYLGYRNSGSDQPATQSIVATAAKDGRIYLVRGLLHTGGILGQALWRKRLFGASGSPGDAGIPITPAYFDAGPNGRFLYIASAANDEHRGLVAIKFDDLNGETSLGCRVIQFEGDKLTQAPGAPFVSSNGALNGIVWIVDSYRDSDDNDGPQSRLRAWDAVTGRLLYTSPTFQNETVGDGRKFVGIVVIDGRVLVPADGVVCYGSKNDDGG